MLNRTWLLVILFVNATVASASSEPSSDGFEIFQFIGSPFEIAEERRFEETVIDEKIFFSVVFDEVDRQGGGFFVEKISVEEDFFADDGEIIKIDFDRVISQALPHTRWAYILIGENSSFQLIVETKEFADFNLNEIVLTNHMKFFFYICRDILPPFNCVGF